MRLARLVRGCGCLLGPPRNGDTPVLTTSLAPHTPHARSPIFYMRKKVQKDLFNATEELARFTISDW